MGSVGSSLHSCCFDTGPIAAASTVCCVCDGRITRCRPGLRSGRRMAEATQAAVVEVNEGGVAEQGQTDEPAGPDHAHSHHQRGASCSAQHVLCEVCTERYLTVTLLPKGMPVFWEQIACPEPNCSVKVLIAATLRRSLPLSVINQVEASQKGAVAESGEGKTTGGRGGAESDAEDQISQLSQRYLSKHTQRCPGCSIPIQRTGGCNHMTCSLCHYHFTWTKR